MNLQFDLSEENKALCRLEKREEIYYCIPLDIDLQGDYRKDSYTVMTDRRLLILEEGTLTKEFRLEECESLSAEPQIACGILFVVSEGREILLGRFSAKHLTRYSYLARGMLLLKRGRTEKVVSHELERTCPKCGRGLPGTRECPHCSGKKTGFVREFLSLMTPHALRMAVIMALMLLSSAVALLSPLAQRYLVDDLLTAEGKHFSDAVPCLLVMLVLALGAIFINVGKNYLCAKLGSVISEDLRRQVFEKVQQLSLSFINDRSPGELINRIMRDTSRIKDFCADVFCNLITVVVSFVFVLVYMLVIHWKLALLSFLFLPISIGLSAGCRHRIHKRFHMQHKRNDKLHGRLRDVIAGMAVVKDRKSVV